MPQIIRYYPIVPVPAPRQLRNSHKRSELPTGLAKFYAFRDLVLLSRVDLPPAFYHVVFLLPMPPSWSNRKHADLELEPHRSKPDKDNLEKALLDAVCKGDDAHVWDGRATKLWHWRGGFLLSDRPIDLVDALVDVMHLVDQQARERPLTLAAAKGAKGQYYYLVAEEPGHIPTAWSY